MIVRLGGLHKVTAAELGYNRSVELTPAIHWLRAERPRDYLFFLLELTPRPLATSGKDGLRGWKTDQANLSYILFANHRKVLPAGLFQDCPCGWGRAPLACLGIAQ
jgi:hypothetical protein